MNTVLLNQLRKTYSHAIMLNLVDPVTFYPKKIKTIIPYNKKKYLVKHVSKWPKITPTGE